MDATPCRASCGCSPTVAWTSGWRLATANASSDEARSQPTVTIVPTPAANASATTSAAESRAMWQCESTQLIGAPCRCATGPVRGWCTNEPKTVLDGSLARRLARLTHGVMRGNSAGPLVTGRPPGYRPHSVSRGTRWSHTAPGRPMRSQIAWAVPGIAGAARMATIRSASRASPSTASTRVPGSSFHGSLASRWALVARTQLPRRLQSAVRGDLVPRGDDPGDGVRRRGRQRAVGGRSRSHAAALRADDRGDPGDEVAEVVGQVGVVAADEPLVGEVAVLSVGGVGEDVVAEAVDADGVDEVERLDDVARRLAHLLPLAQQPPADGPSLRRLDAGRQQHRRPVHAVLADDVLADQVVVDRPPLLEALRIGAEADRGEVVGQRVEPHVRHVARVPRQRDAPRQAGAADGEVAQPGADQPERLVAAELRHDRAGVGGVPVEQTVLEARQAEEVVLLLELLDRQLVDRAEVAGQQVVVAVVQLAAHAVLAPVQVELDVAGVVAALQQLDDGRPVPRLGRADEVVVGDLQVLPRLGELRGDRVGERLRLEPGRLGGPLDLQPVLVGAGEEVDVVAEQAVPARAARPRRSSCRRGRGVARRSRSRSAS